MGERILVVGEALVDVVHRRDGTVDEHPGGSPLNVTIGLARLGHPVEFATRFARDEHGLAIRAHLDRERLLTLRPGADTAERTSTATAIINRTGAATYDFDLAWDLSEVLDEGGAGHLHTGSLAATLPPGAQAVLAAARRAHDTGTVSYDPNARPALMGSAREARASVERLVALADVVKASDEDIGWCYDGASVDEVVEHWGSLGPLLVVVTRGGRGCRARVTATGERADLPAGTPVVVDTVGAGDSFMAGLISGLLDAGLLGGLQAREALRAARLADVLPALTRATSCADATVSRAGADLPTRTELTA